MKSATDFDVLVIGAGVAGLAALQALDKSGQRVMLLEARDRLGGRVHTVHDPLCSLPLELGAEFVHGKPPQIWDIIRDAGLAVYDGTDESRYINNGSVERHADAWELVGSVIEDMREAAKGLDQSFEDFLQRSKYDTETKRAARGYIEGFNAADAKSISIQALAEETAAADAIDGDRVFRFSHGYDAVPLHLLRDVPAFETNVRLNTVVETVAWKPGQVMLETRHGLTGELQRWSARKLVITVPLGVLQSGSIAFSPVPSDIVAAAQRLCCGQVFRLVLRFDEAFWETKNELKDAGFLLSNEALFPTWWTSLAMRSKILTGWSAGAHADGLIGLSREAIVQQALQSLARITGFTADSIRLHLAAAYFHDWQKDPHARCAYSYVPAGALDARKQLAIPVADTLYFAGEATDQDGHSATVHGAIASGRRAAQQITGFATSFNMARP